MALGPRALAAGYGLHTFDAVSSTNAKALSMIHAGMQTATWVVAASQTAGRGRGRRAWHSPAGNLYASLLLPDPAPQRMLATLSLVTAVAVVDTLDPFLNRNGQQRLSCKWPNDVLVDGAKISGILLEAPVVAGKPFVVIGIGINCQSYPRLARYEATSLLQAGCSASASQVFAALTEALHDRLRTWNRGAGFDTIGQLWKQRAFRLGKRVRVCDGKDRLEGTFADIDEWGRMVLRLDDGSRRLVSAGDVYV